MKDPKEILIKKEQFIPIMKMFLDDVAEDKILNKFSEENLFNGYYPFRINGVTLGDRLDINEHTGNLYPHFDVYYEGYVNQHNKISVAKLIVMEIEKYFNNLVVSPNSSFNFIRKNMDLKESIRKILKEEIEIPVDNDMELIDDLVREYGIDTAIKYLGGIDNYINIRYGGDIKEYSKENHLKLVIISDDKMNMYINELLIKKLGIEDNKYTSWGEKKLGKFRYGAKNGIQYAFNAGLMPGPKKHNLTYYRVVGSSGDSGFGYSFINKRNTLGKRYREQIFNQIVDKYKLQEYL